MNRQSDFPRDPKLIGGSDVAAICGESEWSSPIEVWCRLTGQPLKREQNKAMMWGLKKEPIIVDSFCEDMKASVQRNVTFNHPELPYCITPDGINLDMSEPLYLEVKAPRAWKRKLYGAPGSADVEKQYYMQTQHGLGILNAMLEHQGRSLKVERCHMRVLFGGDEDVDFIIPINREFISDMWTIVEDFLDNYVRTNTPPPPDASQAYRDFLVKYYDFPEKQNKTVVDLADILKSLDDGKREGVIQAFKTFQGADERAKETVKELEQLKNVLADACGPHYGIASEWGRFLFYPVAGRVKYTEVIEKLAEKYGIPKALLDEIQEAARGEESRVPRFYPNKD